MNSTIWAPNLTAEEAQWQEMARRLTADHFAPAAAVLDAEQRYPVEYIDILRDSGIGGMILPKPYGGGASITALCAVMEEVAAGCASTSGIIATLQLGVSPVLLAGTDEQKRRFLLKQDGALKSVAFALSEEGAGSDPAAISLSAVREGGKWRLKGEKCWIGGGGVSDSYVVFAQTKPGAGHRWVAAFLVDAAQGGVTVVRYEDKMGMRGTVNAQLRFDALVDDSAMLAGPGQAFRVAMGALEVGRISVAAQSCGIAMAAYHAAAKHAAQRVTFGSNIIDHQGIGFPLADIATRLSAARMLMYAAAAAYQAGQDVSVIAAQAKLFCSEVAHDTVNLGVQIFGGAGYVKPNLVERLYRDQRATEIYEGTSEIQRLVIARAIKAEHTEISSESERVTA